MTRSKAYGNECRKTRAIRLTALALLLITLLSVWPPEAHGGRLPVNILILHSYHQGYEWTDSINRGILSELEKEGLGDANVFVEYMDTKRYGLEAMAATLTRVYSRKYGTLHLDVIIACDDNALKFLIDSRDTLFRNAPVVFCGVSGKSLAETARHLGFTGVMDNKDIRGTIGLALRMLPDLRHLAVISDGTTTGQVLLEQFGENAGQFEKKVTFLVLDDLSREALGQRLRQLPKESAILLLSLFNTADHDSYSMQSAVDFIASYTDSPIFILNDVYLGKGVVGGSVVSGQQQGSKAVEIAKLVMDGAPANSIPIISRETTVPMFDYAALSKKHIFPGNLPANSILINKPFSIYEAYAPYIWSIIGIIVAQGLTIALLIAINIRRKRAEAALRISENKYRTIFETANEGIWVGDRNQLTLMVNSIFAKMLGYAENEIVGRPITDFMHPADLLDHRKQMLKREKGLDTTYERRFITSDGTLPSPAPTAISRVPSP